MVSFIIIAGLLIGLYVSALILLASNIKEDK